MPRACSLLYAKKSPMVPIAEQKKMYVLLASWKQVVLWLLEEKINVGVGCMPHSWLPLSSQLTAEVSNAWCTQKVLPQGPVWTILFVCKKENHMNVSWRISSYESGTFRELLSFSWPFSLHLTWNTYFCCMVKSDPSQTQYN